MDRYGGAVLWFGGRALRAYGLFSKVMLSIVLFVFVLSGMWPLVLFAEDPLDRLDPNLYGTDTLLHSMYELEAYQPPQAVDRLIALIGHSDMDVARTAARMLRRMGRASTATNPAAQILRDPNRSVSSRSSAAMGLGELRHPGAVEPLGHALKNDNEEIVRMHAAYALGELCLGQAADALVVGIREDSSPLVRGAAVHALGNLWITSSQGLEEAILDSDAGVRVEAAWAIGRRKLTGLQVLLVAALNDTDCRVGAASAWALGKLENHAVCEPLTQIVESSCRLTGQAARWSLQQLGPVCSGWN